jgi:hypothetical protein
MVGEVWTAAPVCTKRWGIAISLRMLNADAS